MSRKSDWSGRRDSNPRPRPWQGRALPLSYTRVFNRLPAGTLPATGSQSSKPDPLAAQRRVFKEFSRRSRGPKSTAPPSSVAMDPPSGLHARRWPNPSGVHIAEAAIAGQDVGPARLERQIPAIFINIACADVDKRTPGPFDSANRTGTKCQERSKGGRNRQMRTIFTSIGSARILTKRSLD